MQGDALFLHSVRLFFLKKEKKLNLSLEAKMIKVGVSLYPQHNADLNTTGVFKGILVILFLPHVKTRKSLISRGIATTVVVETGSQ